MARILPEGKWETVADLLAISRIALSVSTVKNPTLQRAGTRHRGALRVVRDRRARAAAAGETKEHIMWQIGTPITGYYHGPGGGSQRWGPLTPGMARKLVDCLNRGRDDSPTQ